MKRHTRREFMKTALAGAAGAMVVPTLIRAEGAKPDTTIDCLKTAHARASEAQTQAAAFAKQADAEGFTQVASLFRAAARSKEANVAEFARLLKKLGGATQIGTKAPDVKSTKENIEVFAKGETNDKETVYPDFTSVAREEKNKDAVKAFNYAKGNADEYAAMFGDALANPDKWKGGTKVIFVCTVCGLPALELPKDKCPSCFEPLEKFIKVS